MYNIWLKLVGLSGASAVAFGAAGAHLLLKKDENLKDIWKTANFYHLIHTCALAYVATFARGKARNIAGSLFFGGMILYSGSIYAIVLTETRKPFSSFVPCGGMCLMAGWLALAFL
jgi:uncharacterized membrane protein YgdD (TMEM256/DUF423 family)